MDYRYHLLSFPPQRSRKDYILNKFIRPDMRHLSHIAEKKNQADTFVLGKKISPAQFAEHLFDWYKSHKRTLPWRATSDPYKIWLSEIMLQQTQVAQALPYYKKFIQTFPNIHHLAQAPEQQVLHLWQGLGYYSRARHLHTCSKYIVQHLNGNFPTHYKELIKLPGIGPYTAAAIASIAFNEKTPVLDGNVYRLLARLFGLKEPINTSQNKIFRTLTQQLMPTHAPATYNQAIMEFGALCCTPRKPNCSTCPLHYACYAYHTNTQALLPVKQRTIKVKQRYLHYLVIHFNNNIYLKKRTHNDIWLGLYDFYLIEDNKALSSLNQLSKHPLVNLIGQHNLNIAKSNHTAIHQLTHQRLHTCFFHIYANDKFIKHADHLFQEVGMKPYDSLRGLPMSTLIQRFCSSDLSTYNILHAST